MEWMLVVMELIIGWGENWVMDVDKNWLIVEKGDRRKEKVELWEMFKMVLVRGDLVIYDGYGRSKRVMFGDVEGLKKVFEWGCGL